MGEQGEHSVQWWGSTDVSMGTCRRWKIGPLSLWIQRLPGEWRIARASNDDPSDFDVQLAIPEACDDLLAHTLVRRFGVSGDNESVTLRPALADRALISTPQRPFIVPAGEDVTLYITSPLWVQLSVGAKSTSLEDFSIHQPPDTWFGPNTQVGEICYASRSFCRVQLDAIPRLPHRATTSVVVENHASTPLTLERIKLPVPFLSLFCEEESGDLWTNDVVFERVEGEPLAPLRVSSGVPAAAPNATELVSPRKHSTGNIMIRAFETLFSEREGS